MSITGQVGHIGFARQTQFGSPNTNYSTQYSHLKITGDSLVASNNPLMAEGEIGMDRDVSDAVPGGFAGAGAINGNLRVRAASVLLEGVLGTKTLAYSGGGQVDLFTPASTLPVWTLEKRIGPASPSLLAIQYQDAMVNTLNITAPGGALATFSAGIVSAGETSSYNYNTTPSYPSTVDDLLVFHGGRIQLGPNGGVINSNILRDDTFQSMEVAINNNVATDEYTVRPSRFLRSLTEGIRQIDCNFTMVFANATRYAQFAYGNATNSQPGYSFYLGTLTFFMGNWQIGNFEDINTAVTATPTNPQALELYLWKVAFTGFPVALASGRISVTSSARALRDPNQSYIASAYVRPTGAGLNY